MKRQLITLYFDCEEDLGDNDRDTYRFILNYEDGNFKEKLDEVFEKNKLVWGKFKEGYKTIYSSYQINITDIDEY